MEVNLKGEAALGVLRIHVLTIFPEGTGEASFERLFSGLSILDESSRNGREEITGISLSDWVERVHSNEGICIAAHVDSDRGVRRLFRQTALETIVLVGEEGTVEDEKHYGIPDALREYILASNIDAIEIAHSTDGPHYRWSSELDNQTRWIPTVLTFDAHSEDDLQRPERVTHMKMTQSCFTGLVDSLGFPDTRIRFPEYLPSPPSPRILGIQIQGAAESFFPDLTMAFGDNLSCLIGVRGSGKSTLVEVLRYVFGYNRSLKELGALKDSIRDLQEANLQESLLRVIYQPAVSEKRILEATYDQKDDYTTRVFDENGDNLEVADVEVSGEYPLRLFGWSEIELLGRDPARQRDLLDRLIPGIKAATKRKHDQYIQLGKNRATVDAQIKRVLTAFNESDAEIRRYSEHKTDFEQLNTKETQALFSSLDLAEGQVRVLKAVSTEVVSLKEWIGEPEEFSLIEMIKGTIEKEKSEVQDWWDEIELKELSLVEVEEKVRSGLREALSRLDKFGEQVARRFEDYQEGLKSVQSELRTQFAEDTSLQRIADLRANAEKRLRKVSKLRDSYLKEWDTLIELLSARSDLAVDSMRIQNEIAGLRALNNERIEERLNQFLPEELNVGIRFNPGEDVHEYVIVLNPLISSVVHYKARNVARTLAAHHTPPDIAAIFLEGRVAELKGLTSQYSDHDITDEDVERIKETSTPFEEDTYASVQVLRDGGDILNAILDLQEVPWDDHEFILLNGAPVNEKSPGQRSSAMLPLVALTDVTPLVIDQPEDNLDKRLVGEVLVKILAELKENRQMIVCTHDPNILVGGDAEQVVVLEALSDRKGQVESHGSIDNEDIVDTVLSLLEGGAKAFQTRRKRYAGRVGD